MSNPRRAIVVDPNDDPFFDVRNKLFDEIVLLTDLWEQYKALFMTSEERVARLNDHARWFFATVQRTFLNELIIGVSRITDRAKSGGHENVTCAALLEDPRVKADDSLADTLQKDLTAVDDAAEAIRRHRNKRVAHLDHAVTFGQDLLPTVKVGDIQTAIEQLQRFHDRYGVEVFDRSTFYDMRPLGSAEQLAKTLDLAPTRRELALCKKLEEFRRLRGLPQ